MLAGQYPYHIKKSQLNCNANQTDFYVVTGFYMGIGIVNGLIMFLLLPFMHDVEK